MIMQNFTRNLIRNSRRSWQWDDQTGDGLGITRVMGVEKVDDDRFKTILWLDIKRSWRYKWLWIDFWIIPNGTLYIIFCIIREGNCITRFRLYCTGSEILTQNRFSIRASVNQCSRNHKKLFWPPDIHAKTDKTVTLPYFRSFRYAGSFRKKNSNSTDEACLNAWLTQVKTQFISVFPHQNYTVFSTKFKYRLTLWTLFIQSPSISNHNFYTLDYDKDYGLWRLVLEKTLAILQPGWELLNQASKIDWSILPRTISSNERSRSFRRFQ